MNTRSGMFGGKSFITFSNEFEKLHRIGGPAFIWDIPDYNFTNFYYVNGFLCHILNEYQKESGMTDEDISIMILKFGKFR